MENLKKKKVFSERLVQCGSSKVSQNLYCCRSMSYMFGTTWGWINVEFYFWVNNQFDPLNRSLLSLSRAEKHLHATSAIGSCPLPFISIHRASQDHRHRATFFSFRMCVRPHVERDLLCTFPLKKKKTRGWTDEREDVRACWQLSGVSI